MTLQQRRWQGLEITLRPEDGFFDATAAASAFHKQAFEYLRLERTKAYLEALKHDASVPKEVVKTVQRGRESGSWFHPRLMLDFARWLDVRFAVWMDAWILEVLASGREAVKEPVVIVGTASVAQRQEAARPKPLYLHQLCILNERDLHVQVVVEVRRRHPHALLVGGICEQAEGAAGRVLAGQLGYTAGQPDLLVLNRGPTCAGLALEFKHPGFGLDQTPPSEVQTQYHRRLRGCGWQVVVCNSAFEAVLKIDDYMRTQVQCYCECCDSWWPNESELQAHVRRKSLAAVKKRRHLAEAQRRQRSEGDHQQQEQEEEEA